VFDIGTVSPLGCTAACLIRCDPAARTGPSQVVTFRIAYEIGTAAAVARRPMPHHLRTGPYTAVREVTLLLVNECGKTKRLEVGIGKPNRQGFGSREIPGTKTTAGGVTCHSQTHP
jgi:hypothetical protein